MAKKLLNLTFSSGFTTFNLGANSADNITGQGVWPNELYHKSNKEPLNQVGCLIYADSSHLIQHGGFRCYQALVKSGYGSRAWYSDHASTFANSPKYYLQVSGLEPNELVPYIQFNSSGVMEFHDANGTAYPIFTIVAGGGRAFTTLCGNIYDDGTFTGDLVAVFPHEIGSTGLYSKRIYDWRVNGGKEPNSYHLTNTQVINPDVIAILQDYIPQDPEGEFIPEGVGDLDASSDNIELPDLPTLSAIDTRMLRVYRMTSENLSKFNKFLWSDLFDVNTFKKLFTDPMQAVLNLNISPINVDVLGPAEIKLGNINTGVQGEMCQQQYQRIDFGTIRLNEYWASFADYSPYTRLSIYLPYVGVQSLSIDDVMNGTIQLVGYCDVLTGSILYVLKSNQVNRAGHSHNSVLYSWGGNCQYQIPLTANNMSSVISSITGTVGSVAGAIGATVATGGLTAPIAVGAIGSAVTNTLNAKTQIQRGGGVGGASGMFGVQRPYLILERPEQRTIQDFGGQIGNPADVTDYLGNFSGFVKVKAVHVENITGATEAEQTEIERLLKDGVIL